MMKKICLGLLMFTMSGCFGKKSLNCSSIDWTRKGLDDGKLGFDEVKVLELKKKCEEQGVEASVVDYKEGWLLGIEIYCSPQNAFKLGREGQKALEKNNCPVEFKTNFAESFKLGKELKEINDLLEPLNVKAKNLKQEKSELEKKINENRREISKVENKIFEYSQKKENLKSLSRVPKTYE